MSSSRYVGRHGGAGRRRISLSSLAGSAAARTAVKSVAGVGIVLGSGAFVIAPSSAIGSVDAGPSVLGAEQTVSATDLLAARDADAGTQSSTASRSAQRSAPAAITAPGKASKQAGTGELDIEPVAKPKPEPKPQPEPEETEPEESETAQAEPEETEATQESQRSPEPEPSTSTESESRESTAPAPSGVQAGGYEAEASEIGLGPNASRVYSAVRNQFPDMTNIGGYRAGDPGDHGAGRAVDIMVTGSRGDQVAAWLQQNAGSLNIKYVIWEQRIWYPGSSWSYMEDRGSATANHYDHVHVSVN